MAKEEKELEAGMGAATEPEAGAGRDQEEQRDKIRRAMTSVVWVLAMLSILLTGCGAPSDTLGDPVEAYLTAIGQLEDPEAFAEEEGMNYIAVDTRYMTGFGSKDDKKRFLSELSDRYGTEVLDKNQVQLARGGYLRDNTSFDDGVLFRLRELDYSTYDENPVVLEVAEWGRGTETMLRRRVTLEAEDGEWTVTDMTEITEKGLY
ncbi:hypothetical protein [Bacilliculturomica massiliensis]|uniref:hypothetical protein n=1 Tax=Bacilliculturomica massiliensis TaxID=1917867 RepID=UPI00102FB3E0|nr:hypothetical protein [Bacilliculturomica massiliensis]